MTERRATVIALLVVIAMGLALGLPIYFAADKEKAVVAECLGMLGGVAGLWIYVIVKEALT